MTSFSAVKYTKQMNKRANLRCEYFAIAQFLNTTNNYSNKNMLLCCGILKSIIIIIINYYSDCLFYIAFSFSMTLW